MSEFLNKLTITEIDDKVFQLVDNPFRYRSDIFLGVVEVPIGFYTDFASVPRLGTIYALLGDSAHEPAVIHDWLYYSALRDRETSDNILLEAMGVIGMPFWKKYPIYWGVRLGGWYAWDQHRTAGHGPTLK